MRYPAIALLAVLASGCTSVLSPKIDELTGTTLAQRCVDYRVSLASAERALLLAENEDAKASAQLAYDTARGLVEAYCSLPPPPVAAE